VAKNKMTERELVSRIEAEITDSLGYGDELSLQREKAMDYYYAMPFGNEVDGRSQFVDSTVMDTIEWIKPSLMRVFASGDDMVKFSPVGPEDVPMAQQATDYVNYVFTKMNPGWSILYAWFTDALLSKNGIIKVWWDENSTDEREEYFALTDDELNALLSDENVEVLEHTEDILEQDNDMGGITAQPAHDITIKRTIVHGQVRVENVPPDEFLIARESKTIEESRFVCHRVKKTLSDLREMYGDIDPEDLSTGSQGDMGDFTTERSARYAFDGSNNFGFNTSETEEALQTYWLHENYLKTDYDGDGIAELRKVSLVGSYVLENEAVDYIPFVSITPISIPHKFFGLSVADLVMDLQLIKSTLMRNLMDNAYNQNFGRYAVLEGQANLDDLLTQRPGGVVRVKSPNAIMPLATPPLESYSFDMLEYLDGVRESRAGVSKMSQGLDENALKSHTTATAVNAVTTAAQSRVELIARNFAETGVRQLMRTIYNLLQRHQDIETVMELRGEWVQIRPFSWRPALDCTVSVGLGSGNRDQQLMHLSAMIQFASETMAGGLQVVSQKNMYNMGAELIKNMGFQNVQDFLTDPDTLPPAGPSPEEQQAQAEVELKNKELDIKAADVQIKAQKLQLDAQNDQVEARLKSAELNLEAQQDRPVAIGRT
jgi:hypothetical protein